MSKSIVKGSISDMADKMGTSLAESLMSAEILVLLDVSYSMDAQDARNGKSRHSVAHEELINLQETNEGKIALVCFSDTVITCFDGNPVRANGSTNLTEGLNSIRMVDGTDIKIIVISDGEPNSESRALETARTFSSKINTLYIGPESGGGRRFLEKLANQSGGQSLKSEEIGSLHSGVTFLLTG